MQLISGSSKSTHSFFYRSMTAANFSKRRPCFSTPECNFRDTMFAYESKTPPDAYREEKQTEKHVFLVETTPLPYLEERNG